MWLRVGKGGWPSLSPESPKKATAIIVRQCGVTNEDLGMRRHPGLPQMHTPHTLVCRPGRKESGRSGEAEQQSAASINDYYYYYYHRHRNRHHHCRSRLFVFPSWAHSARYRFILRSKTKKKVPVPRNQRASRSYRERLENLGRHDFVTAYSPGLAA